MTTFPATVPIPDALPNPRGGAVLLVEATLAEASTASDEALARALRAGAAALRDAGWLAAQRYALALAAASLATPTDGAPGPAGLPWRDALRDFRWAVARRNLRELACSPVLHAHYRAACASAEPDRARAVREVPFEALALAGRPVPPARLEALPAERLAHLRAVYEAALLIVLREPDAPPAAALDALDACLAALAGSDPYDYWRLARACLRALRGTAGVELRRWLARGNLQLREQANGACVADVALVRETLALVWRDLALYGAAAEDAAEVELLNDYGLTVDWHVAGSQASEMLWEADAARAEADALRDAAAIRQLGVVTVNGHAYEDFLQTADASMTELAGDPAAADATQAWRASAAAYRVGAAAAALGLGQAALLADAVALGWRRITHGHPPGDGGAALAAGSDALRAALYKIAAGVAPPDLAAAREALGAALEAA
ncbi:hypothetical protein [Burkholderia plantarii]|uniref:hypothetical protein n=1 Tax=Burkholderia plantarii TaxID=41899 RepID=UPI0018DE5522|nr:hypothetical protein [Burkholderia plantarii]MBI0326144.1 hypothetical protein [Burkholderia plantarii]